MELEFFYANDWKILLVLVDDVIRNLNDSLLYPWNVLILRLEKT